MKLATILDFIDNGQIALPEFQRGYVWNRDQVRSLMQSLYRRYPVGSLLVWTTKTETTATRGDGPAVPGVVKLLLDGQQRITTLYGIIRGRAPAFFDGNAQAFTGLWFNLETETFAFHSPLKMDDDPMWIDVTQLMREGAGSFIARIADDPAYKPKLGTYIARLNAIDGIKQIDFHIDDITGEDKTVDLVVDIFNRVNSGGTKLSKGDLALARICAAWPEARDEMKKRLEKWREHGFEFKLELLLRCITTITTGQAFFEKLADIDTATFRDGLHRAERAIDQLLDTIGARLGLDFDRVLGSRYSLPLMARYLVDRNFELDPAGESDRLLFWYVHSFLWGRYAGSTETVLSKDLALIRPPEGALDRLIAGLRSDRGDLRVHAGDFVGWSQGARFYPVLYMLTRTNHARDWGTGHVLSAHLLGKRSRLELHHVFPKALLYRHGYERAEVNALANFTFLTQETNLRLADRDPVEYLPEIEAKLPGALASHRIPLERELWRLARYRDFLAARRELLAQAANAFLEQLHGAPIPEAVAPVTTPAPAAAPAGGFADEAEERELWTVNAWAVARGLPPGELLFELADPETGAALAILDLAWPESLQPGLSPPVAILLDEDEAVHRSANRAGFRFFTDVASFRRYVESEVLALEAA